MKNTETFNEIKSWFEGNRDLAAGMKLHTKYSKNAKNIKQLALTLINRKSLLETYLQEILNSCKPTSEPKFSSKPKIEILEQNKVFHQSFQERLQKEFPKIKFSELPDTLKLLVYKRFDAWEQSKEYHKLQHEATSDEQRFEAAKNTVQAIMENWSIWAELDHFHKTGKILGKHQDFEKDEFKNWIEELEKKPVLEFSKEFTKFRGNARYNINNYLRKLKEKPLSEEQEEKLNLWIYKHDIISAKLQEPLWNNEETEQPA